MRLIAVILTLLVLFSVPAFSQEDNALEVLLFSSAHCHPCQEIKKEFIPRIKERYKGRIKLIDLDFERPENLARLMYLQDRYNWHPEKNQTPTIFVNGKFLVGSDEIKEYLALYIDTALSELGYVPIPEVNLSVSDLISRFQLIRPIGVISAGLIDVVNPCAFTAIIFFISFLTLQGYARRQVLIIGLSFILAVFITYVLIGIGLFNFLYKLKGYWVAVKVVYVTGALLCFVLAGFAFYHISNR